MFPSRFFHYRLSLDLSKGSTRAGSALFRLAASCTSIVHLTRGLGVVAGVLDRRSIFVVGVDASKLTTLDSSHTLDVDVALALLRTVTARTVQLAVVIDVEVLEKR